MTANRKHLMGISYGGNWPNREHPTHQLTMDDTERVLPRMPVDPGVAVVSAARNEKCSCAGRQLYEKIQEQKELEDQFDPLFD